MNQESNGNPVVLFVDDEVHVLRSLQRALMDEPLTTLTAESGEQALRTLAREHIDVVVSDERMPGMSGSTLLTEVKNRHPEIIRIMLTGHADLEAAMQAINDGRIYRFLLKPVATDELASVIQKALRERAQSERLLSLSQQAGDVCSFEVLKSSEGRTRVRWSRNARTLLELPPDADLEDLDLLYSRLHPDDETRVRELNASCLKMLACASTEYRIRLSNDRIRWIAQTSDVAVDPGTEAIRLLSVLRDITESKKQRERLEYQAYHDVLTGLGNRALLLDGLDEALHQSGTRQTHVALLFIDLDDFKIVNDSMGHAFGDWLLQAFAQRLNALELPAAMAARLGGDEFALLLRVDDAEQAGDGARAVQEALAEPFRHGDYEVHISASIGIALGRGAETAGLDLLREADTAMYAAKYKGKGSFRLFDKSMHDKASERFVLVGDMHRSLARDYFFLAFQPIVRLDTLVLAGYEALARWQHPERGLVMPNTFIPLAEESGLITRLGRQVTEKACRQAREWIDAHPEAPPFMSFNVSVQQLHEADLASRLDAIITDLGLDPGLIKLEITESGLMHDVQLSMDVLARLKALGVKLQIDDFGTGYSSLRYLQRIPADSLKVDKSFVMGMENDAEKRAIVRTIIDLARSLGMTVVAEGVETRAQLLLLRELGCEYGQGYLFDKPLPPEEAAQRRDYAHTLEIGN
ncbi:diguanylate cyclase (GGDEF) domain-containing protein [Desulfonatronum zhilinae]|nr:diguanylate cyclase (GGDEF) domain-containing protein [Desulfonatronum zhilinae]